MSHKVSLVSSGYQLMNVFTTDKKGKDISMENVTLKRRTRYFSIWDKGMRDLPIETGRHRLFCVVFTIDTRSRLRPVFVRWKPYFFSGRIGLPPNLWYTSFRIRWSTLVGSGRSGVDWVPTKVYVLTRVDSSWLGPSLSSWRVDCT